MFLFFYSAVSVGIDFLVCIDKPAPLYSVVSQGISRLPIVHVVELSSLDFTPIAMDVPVVSSLFEDCNRSRRTLVLLMHALISPSHLVFMFLYTVLSGAWLGDSILSWSDWSCETCHSALGVLTKRIFSSIFRNANLKP